MQFRAAQVVQVRRRRPTQRPLGGTVPDRWIPLVPAAWGAPVARPGEDDMSDKGAVSSAELGSRSGPASALSDLVDHEGESDANHPGVLGQGDALLRGTKRALFSHAGGPHV